MSGGWNPLEHCDGSGETRHVDDCPCVEHGGDVAVHDPDPNCNCDLCEIVRRSLASFS